MEGEARSEQGGGAGEAPGMGGAAPTPSTPPPVTGEPPPPEALDPGPPGWVADGEPARDCPGCAARVPARARTCPACGLTLRDPMRESRVSQRLRALGGARRDRSDESDTLVGLPPLKDDEPLPEVAPRQPAGPRLPPVHPRRLTWLLLVGLALACWASGIGFDAQLSPGRAVEVGGLVARGWSEPWRLVVATFVHAALPVAAVGAYAVFLFGGELERRVGAGAVLFLLVVVGAGLNAARVLVEDARSLWLLAGVWPAGLALGGAALALAVLAPAPGARRPPGLLASMAIQAAFVAVMAHSSQMLTVGLQAVMFLALGAGLVAGLLLSLAGGAGQGSGCLLGGVAVAALVAAEAERARGPRSPGPPPWAPPPTAGPDLGDLREVVVDDLRVRLELPTGWREGNPATSEVKCAACEQEVRVPAAHGKAGDEVPCPSCGQGRVRPRPRAWVDWVEGGFFGGWRTVRLYSAARGPFDAADTLAERIGAQMVTGEGWLKDVVPLADRPLSEGAEGGAAWLQAAGWRSAWALVLRGRSGRDALVCRMYFLVGERRTVQLVTIEPDDGAGQGALFDAIARSVRELKD
ncbi:MAG: rhomboid family intramembrane serine protease [Planctomycetes bacterium]|nr:rhomboid family intramembrane serine protease [Planctomycetota bacterium]